MNEVQTSGDSPGRQRCALSIVTMVYKSLPYLDEFVASAAAVASRLAGQSYELIFVVDGSPDDSLQHLRSKQRENPRIVIVDLSRNFGHHQAAWCGLHTARGDLVFIIDCDLEVSPAVLEPFAETMTKSGADVVYGYQESRRGGIASKYLGDAFWRIFNLLSTTRVPHSICTERLMSRRYVDTLLTLGDRNLFLAGMYFWAGFEQVGVKITKQSRKGRPVYTVFRRFQLMVRAISAFSSLPLQMSFWVGLAIALGCVAYGMVLLVRKIVHPDAILSGFTTLALLTSLSAGMIMMSLGVIGLYISRIYSQTQNRPVYLIRSVYRSGQEES
ncbi:MAG TPA: glycosyltransferase family 2 protein [Steroidobacteraceae bacterium]|jgi:putative glycosyltransferase